MAKLNPLTQAERSALYAAAPWLDEYEVPISGPPAGGWMLFKKARTLVRALNLKNWREWEKYSASEKRPVNVPANPREIYSGDGWVSCGDWLGTKSFNHKAANWMSFKKARTFVRSLKLKTQKDWQKYSKSDKKPTDIPACPNHVYATKGWAGINDWLGTERRWIRRRFRPFAEAKRFVHNLNLRTRLQWLRFARSKKMPSDIPQKPWDCKKYKGQWAGMYDWLGDGKRSGGGMAHRWRSFKEARAFVRSRGFKSYDQWLKWAQSKNRPLDIPSSPQVVYDEWVDMADWLGKRRRGTYRSFVEAKRFVHRLKLKGQREWFQFASTKKRPTDIPYFPNRWYKDWVDYQDWLGKKWSGAEPRKYRSFHAARKYVRSLGLKTQMAWRKWSTSGKRPSNIPGNPWTTYIGRYKNIADWLGSK